MSSATSALALVVAVAGWAACARGDLAGPPTKTPSPGLLSFKPAVGTAPADGATQLRLIAVVDSPQRSVTFHTSAGTFPSGRDLTVSADDTDSAVAVLTAPNDTMTAEVTASVGGTTQRVHVQFVPALPSRIDVATDQPSVPAAFTTSLQVTATLRRNPGTATQGQKVTFLAHAPGDALPRGRFSSSTALSDAAGKAQVRFAPADTTFTGPLVIEASAAGQDSIVRASTVVQVVPAH